MSKCNWVSCIYKSLLLDVSWKELGRQGADIDQLLTFKEDIWLGRRRYAVGMSHLCAWFASRDRTMMLLCRFAVDSLHSLWSENLVKIPLMFFVFFTIFRCPVIMSLAPPSAVLTFSSLLATSARTLYLVLIFDQSGP